MKQTIDKYVASSHRGLETSTSISHHCMDNVLKTNLIQIGMDNAKQTKLSGAFFHKSCSTADLDGLLGNRSGKVEDGGPPQQQCTAADNLSSEEETPKPKRPLTAYNLFFRSERLRIIGSDGSGAAADDAGARVPREKRHHRKTHGKISFMDLAKQIGKQWRSTDAETRATFEAPAAADMKRYRAEMERYRQIIHLDGGKEEKKAGKDKVPKRKTKNMCADLSSKVAGAGPKSAEVHSSSENNNSSCEHYVITRMKPVDASAKAIEICAPNSWMSGTFCDELNIPASVHCQQQQTQKNSCSSPLLSQLSVSEVTSSQDVVGGLCREAPGAQRSPCAFLDDADLLLNDLLLDEQLQITTAKNNSPQGNEWSNHHGNFVNSPSFQVNDYAATTQREEGKKIASVSGDTRKRSASEECVERRRVSLKSTLPDDNNNESVDSLFFAGGNSEGGDLDSIFDISYDLSSDNTSSDLSMNDGGGTTRMWQESPKASNNVVLYSLTKSMTQSNMSLQLLHALSSGVGTQASQHKTVMRRSSQTRKHLLHALNGL